MEARKAQIHVRELVKLQDVGRFVLPDAVLAAIATRDTIADLRVDQPAGIDAELLAEDLLTEARAGQPADAPSGG